MSRNRTVWLAVILGVLGLTAGEIVLPLLHGSEPKPGDLILIVALMVQCSAPGGLLGGAIAAGVNALREGSRRRAAFAWVVGGIAVVAACVCQYVGCRGAPPNFPDFLAFYALPCVLALLLIVAGLAVLPFAR